MSVLDQQAARRANNPVGGSLSTFGRKVEKTSDKPSYPIRDVPITGYTGPDDDLYDVPFSAEMVNEQAQDAQDRNAAVQEVPTLGGVEQALRLARVLKEKGREGVGEGKFNTGLKMLRDFEKLHPGLMAATVEESKAPPQGDDRVDNSPLPTGISRIDNAGKEVDFGGSGSVPGFKVTVPSIDDLPFDDPLRLRKQRADDGVDMISGVSFGPRMDIARSPEIERLRSEAINNTMGSMFAEIPDDMPKFRYDTALGEFQVLRPSSKGKFRWTSMDGTGLELGDIADMMNPAEILSLGLSIVGTGKVTKAVEFGTTSFARSKVAAGGFAGGLVGRMAGDAISIIDYGVSNGSWPTAEELKARGWKNAQIEGFATVVGELGGVIVRKISNTVQDAAAVASGKQGVKRTDLSRTDRTSIDEVNKNIDEARADLVAIQNATGRPDFTITRGQAWRSIDVLSDEAHARANAPAGIKQLFRRADAANKQITDEYITRSFGPAKEAIEDRYGTIVAANDVMDTAGTISVLKQENGQLNFVPKLIDKESLGGLKITPKNDGWHIDGVLLPPALQDTGIGKAMYIAAAEEAARHGKVLVSDNALSGDAMRMWESLAKSGDIGPVTRTKSEIIERVADGEGRVWYDTADGLPMFKVAEPEAYTPLLLRQEIDPITGKVTRKGEFDRFLNRPGRKEMAAVVDEITANPYLKQDLQNDVLTHYTETVGKGNRFNDEAYQSWKDNVLPNLDNFFTQREMLAIRSGPEGLRAVVDANKKKTTVYKNTLSKVLGVDTDNPLFKDPSNKIMWQQLKSLAPEKRVRAMRILDAGGQGEPIRQLFREDLTNDLIMKASNANYKGYNKWLTANRGLIKDILGAPQARGNKGEFVRAEAAEYMTHLKRVGSILERRSEQNMVKGTATDANPTSLALFRVVFGPLSRAQRFLSGARRGAVRWDASKAADIISDPAALKSLVEINPLQLESRAAARVVDQLGLAPHFGLDGFDPENPQSRKEFADRILVLLQSELTENVE